MKKIQIVGVSKIFFVFVTSLIVVAGAVGWFFAFGIRPFDRVKAKFNAEAKDNPDRALILYPAYIEQAGKAKISVEELGMIYSQYGRFLMQHGRHEEAIAAFEKCIERSANGWLGITKANAILETANCRMNLDGWGKRPFRKSDIDDLKEAEKVHPSRQAEQDKLFWPAYDQSLGQLYALSGDTKNAVTCFEKSSAQFDKLNQEGYGMASSALLVDALVRAGKYSDANNCFIEYCSQVQPEDCYQLRYCFRNALMRAQDTTPGLRNRIVSLLDAGKFDELEKLVEEMSAVKKPWPSGSARCDNFFQMIDYMDKPDFDVDWNAYLGKLENWVKTRPNSAAARIALGRGLLSYAWKARGGGYSDTVSESGWKLFSERLDRAWKVLEQVKDRSPQWYHVTQTCALGQSWEAARYDEMVAECRKRYPDYDPVVFAKAYWLLPRWNGREGELESYVNGEAANRKGIAADILIARTAWSLDYTVDNAMNETTLDWAHVKKGLLQVIKDSPESLLAKGMLSTLAMEKNDTATAKSAFNPKEDK